MLENTLSTHFVPGSNRTGGLARASWRFLLPALTLDKIACFGVPPAGTLSVLAAMAKETMVLSTNASLLEATQRELETQKIDGVRMVPITKWRQLPLADNSVGLAVITGKKDLAKLLRSTSLVVEFKRLLKDDGAIYCEVKRRSERIAARTLMKRLVNAGFAAPRVLWVTPFNGELRTAFPLHDDRMSRYLFTNVLFGQSLKMRTMSRAGTVLSQTGLLRHFVPRRAILLQRTALSPETQAPPDYMIALAKTAGLDLTGLRCGLSARGKFNANKNIFYLFDRRGEKAQAVVKMTRAPEFNPRLENECRVLVTLHEKRFVEPGTYPEPLFFGYHADLALLGQLAVYGEPFRSRTRATIDCPVANDAVDWIVKLGIASANTVAATAVAAALMKLYRRFVEIYPLSNSEAEFLVEQIGVIGRGGPNFPLVFQHGDLGMWNLLVSAEDRVIVIAWGAGEPEGLPLWDLFYFLRSYGNWMSRVQGHKDPLKNFAQNFLEPSPVLELLRKTLERYCSGVGLRPELIAPLFYTCWMHRALKESTRLQNAALSQGTYFNVLRRCIEHRNSAALQTLFSLPPNNQPGNKGPDKVQQAGVLAFDSAV